MSNFPKIITTAASVLLLSLSCLTVSAQVPAPVQGGTSSSLIQASVEHEAGPVNIMFLMDASYSMKEKLGGSEKKINSAKQVLETALTRIPNDVKVGLRVFGQGYSGDPNTDCRQTQCLVPLGVHNRNSIIMKTRTVEPFGLTPLEQALRMTVEDDFKYAQGPKTIILISDGADTCGGDPCRFMSLLPRYNIKVKCDVVGLDLHRDAKARDQLNCVAATTGGKYYDANTAGELIDSVSRSVDKAISGRVIMKPGVPVKNSQTSVDDTLEKEKSTGGDIAKPAGSLQEVPDMSKKTDAPAGKAPISNPVGR